MKSKLSNLLLVWLILGLFSCRKATKPADFAWQSETRTNGQIVVSGSDLSGVFECNGVLIWDGGWASANKLLGMSQTDTCLWFDLQKNSLAIHIARPRYRLTRKYIRK